MAATNLFPKVVLDFTTATIDPRITFARAGATATRFNSSGLIEIVAANTPRFDYNPITLACNGLLIEEQKQNLFTQSSNFSDIVWIKTAASISSGAAISPDGTLNAEKFVENNVNTAHSISRSISVTNGIAYTFSCFAKKSERKFLRLVGATNFVGSVNFDLDDGSFTITAGTPTVSVANVGNGWYRCAITAVTAATTITPNISMALTSSGTGSYQGNGTSGIFIYGAQLEAGSFVTSLIPTTTVAVTRNADVATITGTNFSDWWRANQGGVLVRARPGTVSGTRPWVQFDDNTTNEIIALRGNTTNPELYIVDGGSPQAQIDAGTIAANTDYSLTGWWETNDCKARLDSGAVVTDPLATIPTVTQARLGSDGTNYLNGHLASISYYDTFFGQIYTRRKNKAVFTLM